MLEKTAGKKKDLERRHIEDLMRLLHNETGKKISLPYKMKAEKSYQYILVQKMSCQINKKWKENFIAKRLQI